MKELLYEQKFEKEVRSCLNEITSYVHEFQASTEASIKQLQQQTADLASNMPSARVTRTALRAPTYQMSLIGDFIKV